MTNEEALKRMKWTKGRTGITSEEAEAIGYAIEKLSNSDEDCISRAEAIDALGYDISIESDEGLDAYKTVIKEMLCKIYDVQKENIEKLPSIKPKTDILDKIRAEIESNRNEWIKGKDAEWHTYDRCLLIIDKYTAESEDKELVNEVFSRD